MDYGLEAPLRALLFLGSGHLDYISVLLGFGFRRQFLQFTDNLTRSAVLTCSRLLFICIVELTASIVSGRSWMKRLNNVVILQGAHYLISLFFCTNCLDGH